MLLFHICSTVKSSPCPFPPLSPYLPPSPSQTFFSPLPLLCLLSLPFIAATLGSLGCSTLPHTVRGASLFPSVSLSFFPSVSLCLCLTHSPPSCVKFLYATKSPKCASHIVGYKLVARAEEHSRRLAPCALRLALEMRLSLLYH